MSSVLGRKALEAKRHHPAEYLEKLSSEGSVKLSALPVPRYCAGELVQRRGRVARDAPGGGIGS